MRTRNRDTFCRVQGRPGHVRTRNRGTSGHARTRDRVTSGHVRTLNRVTSGRARTRDRDPFGHVRTRDRVTSGHARTRDRDTSGHARTRNRVTSGHARTRNWDTSGHVRTRSQVTLRVLEGQKKPDNLPDTRVDGISAGFLIVRRGLRGDQQRSVLWPPGAQIPPRLERRRCSKRITAGGSFYSGRHRENSGPRPGFKRAPVPGHDVDGARFVCSRSPRQKGSTRLPHPDEQGHAMTQPVNTRTREHPGTGNIWTREHPESVNIWTREHPESVNIRSQEGP